MHTHEPDQTDTKDQRNEYTKKLVPFPEFKEKPVIDTPVEISDTPPAMNGQSLYNAYVLIRHGKFNDGGSYLMWNHMNPQEQETWNELATRFTR